MTRELQKAEELRAAQLFIEAEWLDAVVEPSESPDVVLRFTSGEGVGLEVARAVEPGIPATVSALQRVERVAEELLKPSPVLVLVDADPVRLAPNRVWERQVAEALVRLVRDIISRGEEERGRTRIASEYPELAAFVDAVQVLATTSEPKVLLTELHLGRAGVGEVQRVLDQKELLLPRYRQRNPGMKQWLLVATHAASGPRCVPGVFDSDHVFTSSFDKVHLMNIGGSSNGVVRLNSRPVRRR
jgi:hypothetical protein